MSTVQYNTPAHGGWDSILAGIAGIWALYIVPAADKHNVQVRCTRMECLLGTAKELPITIGA